MSEDVDKLRSQLYLDLGAFVDLRRAAKDPDEPKWRAEALVWINKVYRYASLDGRRRFFDEMKLPGADQKRRTTFDVCRKQGGDEAACRAQAEAPLVVVLLVEGGRRPRGDRDPRRRRVPHRRSAANRVTDTSARKMHTMDPTTTEGNSKPSPRPP